MEDNRGRLLVGLCWAWVALVVAYMVWGAINHAGLYGWLADLQLERSGSYRQDLTGLIPGFLLAAPALWYIRLRSQIALALEEPGPAAEARRIGRVARNVAMAGILCALVGSGAYWLSQQQPDGSEDPTPIEFAALAAGEIPRTKVSIRGVVDPEVTTGVEESSRYVDRATLDVGFRPEEGEKDEPLRLFVERYFGDVRDARTAQGFMAEQTGYLIENGLPAPALRDLEQRGIRLATPHYVLRTRSEGRRENYYIVAGLAALGAVACLIVALAGSLQAWSRRRRAGLG